MQLICMCTTTLRGEYSASVDWILYHRDQLNMRAANAPSDIDDYFRI
jgi:hypothetical protein